MWGLAAHELMRGHWPEVSAGFPLLMALGASITGAMAWQVGGWLSLCAMAAMGPLIVLLGKRLGLTTAQAAVVAVCCWVVPEALEFAFQLQPDALTVVAVLVGLWGGLRWADGSSPAFWLASLLPLVLLREHGPVSLLAAAWVVAWHRQRRATLALTGTGALVGLAVLLLGDLSLLPARVAQPLVESPLGAGSPTLPSYANELGGPKGRAFAQAWTQGDALSVWMALLERLFARSWENLLWLALAAAGAAYALPARRRWAVWATLAPVLPLFVIWSHRRHTSVLIPVAVLMVLTALARLLPGRAWWAAAALALVGLGRQAPMALTALSGAAQHGHDRIALAAWMQEQPGAWFLGGQHNEVNLHLAWPRSNPELPRPGQRMPEVWPGADWRTLWVSPPGSMPPPFVTAHQQGQLAVWWLTSDAEVRPCADAVPVDGPLFLDTHARGTVEPDCEAPAAFGDRPDPVQGPFQGHPVVPHEDRPSR